MSGVSCRMPVSAINDAIELKVCVTVPEERTWRRNALWRTHLKEDYIMMNTPEIGLHYEKVHKQHRITGHFSASQKLLQTLRWTHLQSQLWVFAMFIEFAFAFFCENANTLININIIWVSEEWGKPIRRSGPIVTAISHSFQLLKFLWPNACNIFINDSIKKIEIDVHDWCWTTQIIIQVSCSI